MFLSLALKNPDICSAGSRLWEGFLSWFPTQKNIFTVQTVWGRHPWKSTGTLPRVLRGAESVPMCKYTAIFFFLWLLKNHHHNWMEPSFKHSDMGPLYHRSLQRCPSLTPHQLPAEGSEMLILIKNFPFKSSLQFTHSAKVLLSTGIFRMRCRAKYCRHSLLIRQQSCGPPWRL